jgi:hypothetical protein
MQQAGPAAAIPGERQAGPPGRGSRGPAWLSARGPWGLLDALRRPVLAATLLAGVLHLIWALFLAKDSGDLAAQYAWTDFAVAHPDAAYNLSWYGGMHPASYSIFSPYLMGWIGVRTTAVIAGTLSTTITARLLVRSGLRRPMMPALWAAFSLWCDVLSGRATFALGLLFALMATALVVRPVAPAERGAAAGGPADGTTQAAPAPARRPAPGKWALAGAVLLGAIATMGSPVAGLFVEVAAAALFLTGRRRDALVLAAGPPVVVGATTLLFPFSGVQPFMWYFALLPFGTAVVIWWLVPREWRLIRVGSFIYAIGVLLSWAIPSPVGSNAERLGLLFGGAVLLAAALESEAGRRRTTGLFVAFVCVAIWQIVKPVTDMVITAPVASTVDHAQALIDELKVVGADRGRVEVVPMRSHWEASGLSPYVNLARGWNRQVDVERNPLFYDGTLTADSYRDWLRSWGVAYVVLPTGTPPDSGAVAEAKIVAAQHSWLRPVWEDAHWKVYRVTGTEPLADPPATVSRAGSAALTVKVPAAGDVLLRVPYSPWLGIESTSSTPQGGCLAQADAAPAVGKGDQWTVLHAPGPGTYRIGARYGLPRGTPCPKPDDNGGKGSG